MSENPNPEKWKRVASHHLTNEDNNSEVLLNTHQNAHAHAIKQLEQQKQAAQLARATAQHEQAKLGSNTTATSHLTLALTPATLLIATPGPITTTAGFALATCSQHQR